MPLNKIIKLAFTFVFIILSGALYAQSEKATLKPSPVVDAQKDKKDKKKAAKAEEKIHEKSKKQLAEQMDEYSKPHYKKLKKQKPATKTDKGL